MPTQETLYNVANRVATITLNRPDKLNAWTALMESEVRSHIENAGQDDEVRVIVLTGAGRGFCAGSDMSLLSAVAERGLDYRDLDDPGREQVLRDGANRREGAAPDFQKKYSYFPAICGAREAGDCRHQRAGSWPWFGYHSLLRSAAGLGRKPLQHHIRAARADCRVWNGLDVASDHWNCKRARPAVFCPNHRCRRSTAHGVGESSFSPGNLSRKGPGVRPRAGFHGEPALVAHNQAPGIRGHVAAARGSFRHFRARDDGVFPHRGFQRGCRALCGEAPRCFQG